MFDYLLKPGKIRNYQVKNRMKYAATVNNFCDYKTGEVTDREVAYLEERAKGGFGIVTSQGAFTHILGKGYPGQMGIHDESMVPGLKRIADAIKKHDAMAVGQIMHTGRYGHPHDYGIDDLPRGPSDFTSTIKRYGKCKGMTKEEIHEQVHAHGLAAKWFKDAGFDGVEVCGIVGYLIADFLSRWTNLRSDEYGGSLENRARFFIEILDEVRRQVGPDYPVLMRLNGTDLIEGGNTEEEYIEIAKMVQDKVDFISVTVGWHESTASAITPDIEPGHWLYIPQKWKKAGIKPPLCMAYRLNYPDVPDKAIADGIIDYWEMCRPGIVDPYIPLKVTEGRPEDIIVCPACNLGCFHYMFVDELMRCTHNPRCGMEWNPAYEIRPAENKKKVLVIGGGPSGMEAARVAAIRGHAVTLYEKNSELGGQMRLGAKSPLLREWNDLVKYYAAQMKKVGVRTELGKEATPDVIKKEKPDVLIIATGSKPTKPELPGIDNQNVTNVFDLLDNKVTLGDKVVFIGGNEIAVQTAEYVAVQGKKVTILEEGKRIGYDINIFNTLVHRRKMDEYKIKTLVNVKVDRIEDEGVVVTTLGGKEATIPADTIVVALPFEADTGLRQQISVTSAPEIYSIGDCVSFRKLYEAIHDGFKVGVKV